MRQTQKITMSIEASRVQHENPPITLGDQAASMVTWICACEKAADIGVFSFIVINPRNLMSLEGYDYIC
jgi:hypothetical protein